jgi:hypothetical protein
MLSTNKNKNQKITHFALIVGLPKRQSENSSSRKFCGGAEIQRTWCNKIKYVRTKQYDNVFDLVAKLMSSV